MAPTQVAQARHHSYRLISQLFLAGITKELLTLVQAVPELARKLPEPFDLDEAAAVHYQLFGFNVFPYESIFLDDSGLLGGRMAEAVLSSYDHFAFEAEAADYAPDHIGQELAALAFLCLAEAEASANGAGERVAALRSHQITFLQNHLLRWLPPFVLAVKEQGNDFFAAVAELTMALLYDHYQSLSSETGLSPGEWALPEPPYLLGDDGTGLKEIAAYFSMPAYSGIFLGRDNVGRLARRLELPRGFGDRRQLLTNLMRSAAQYDQFLAIMKALETAVLDWQTAYRLRADEMPLLQPFVQRWQERATDTIHLITQLKDNLTTYSEYHSRPHN